MLHAAPSTSVNPRPATGDANVERTLGPGRFAASTNSRYDQQLCRSLTSRRSGLVAIEARFAFAAAQAPLAARVAEAAFPRGDRRGAD